VPSAARRIAAGIVSVLASLCLACGKDAPTAPFHAGINGFWEADLSGTICVGDWHDVILWLQVEPNDRVTAELTTFDDQHFSGTGSMSGDRGSLTIWIPNSADCPGVTLDISGVDRDASGRSTRFVGQARGRCCGTLLQNYEFVRVRP